MHTDGSAYRSFAATGVRGAFTAAAALACVLFAAAPASAARAWSAPVDISASPVPVSFARVAVNPRGDAVAVWIAGVTGGTGAHLTLGTVLAAVRPAGGAWQAAVAVSDPHAPATSADVAIDEQGDAVAVWSQYAGKVQSSTRAAGGSWQTPVDLIPSPTELLGGTRVCVNARGDAVAIWWRRDIANGVDHPSVVQSALRTAGGSWQAAVDISVPGQSAGAGAAAIDPGGNVAAIWTQSGPGAVSFVAGATRPAGGAWVAPGAVSASSGQLSPSAAEVAIDPRGDTVAAWLLFGTTNVLVQGAARASHGSWQPFDVSPAGPSNFSLDMALDGQGNAVMVWDSVDIIQSAVRSADGVLQAPVGISVPGLTVSGAHVAVGAQGDAFAVWQRQSPTSNVVQSAVRAAGGAWQAPVDISLGDRSASGAQVAADASGDAVALWVAANGKDFVVQSATFREAGPPPPPPKATIAGLRLTPSRFRVARSGPTARPVSTRRATHVSYTLNTPAGVRFTVVRSRGGRRVGGRCVKPAPGNLRRKICAREVGVHGSFTRRRSAGGDRFVFSGRMAGRTLHPGVYDLVATPTAHGRAGAPARARFRVLR